MSMSKTKRLSTDAVLTALYVLLTLFLSIKAGNLRISWRRFRIDSLRPAVRAPGRLYSLRGSG
jgi:hypothetical protein